MASKNSSTPEPVPTELPPPTDAPPGTVAKVKVLVTRNAAGQLLWNPNDAQLMSDEQGQWEFLTVLGDGKKLTGNPHVAHDICDTESDL